MEAAKQETRKRKEKGTKFISEGVADLFIETIIVCLILPPHPTSTVPTSSEKENSLHVVVSLNLKLQNLTAESMFNVHFYSLFGVAKQQESFLFFSEKWPG